MTPLLVRRKRRRDLKIQIAHRAFVRLDGIEPEGSSPAARPSDRCTPSALTARQLAVLCRPVSGLTSFA